MIFFCEQNKKKKKICKRKIKLNENKRSGFKDDNGNERFSG